MAYAGMLEYNVLYPQCNYSYWCIYIYICMQYEKKQYIMTCILLYMLHYVIGSQHESFSST